MKIAIYTSFAVNYLAKARVLASTLKEHNASIDVVAIVCDKFPDTIDGASEPFDKVWMVEEFPISPIRGWIFRHNIMELCTAVKAWGLKRLLDAGYDYVMYLDPDCFILDDPAKIIDLLPSNCSVGVVPHTTREADSDEEIRIVETSSLRHGIYNLGFLLVRNDDNGHRLAKWWSTRLEKYCIDDFKSGLFTDQRWFDLAVGYFDFIKVIRHHGIDVASWNVGQRVLTRGGNGYQINGDDLIFYHFSGVGPTGVHRWVREKFAPADPLVSEIEFSYEKMISRFGQKQLEKLTPFFDFYTDGLPVLPAHRALYRERTDLVQRFEDPYDVSGPTCFRDFCPKEEEQKDNSLTPLGRMWIGRDPIDSLAKYLFDPDFFSKCSGLENLNFEGLWTEYVKSAWSGKASGNRMFDVEYYEKLAGKIDRKAFPTPFHHYLDIGLQKGISPCWVFDERYYLQRYPDIVDALRRGDIICAFHHFSLYGRSEGRSGCAFFNEATYLDAHPDVASAVARCELRSGEAHYRLYGHRERRSLYGS